MGFSLYIGVAIAVLSIIGLSVYTGFQRNASARAVFAGKKSPKAVKGIGAGVVSGLIMGTFIGGSSTIGTAQLAFVYGMSAWWYTLGGGIGCLIMVIFYLKPYRSGASTVVGMINSEYGPLAGKTASVLNSLGTFISILAQLLSASAILLVFLPDFGNVELIIISTSVMILYVIFGGTKGAGVVGILKLVLLYIAMLLCGYFVLVKSGGIGGFFKTVSKINSETALNVKIRGNQRLDGSYLNMFCRGFGTDFGALLSLVLGIVSTQTYAQAMISARSERSAKIGGLLSAFIIPPIGILGIMVGMFMRGTVDNPATFVTKTALTSFIVDYSGMPDIFAGLVLGVLFVSVVGAGAGIALSIALNVDDIFLAKKTRFKRFDPESRQKVLIFFVFVFATLCACSPISDSILSFSFLSMGLRGCTVFAPLTFLLLAKGKLRNAFAVASIIGGSITAFILGTLDLYGLIKLPCDSVFPGVIVGFLIMIAGFIVGKDKNKLKE